MTDWSQLTHAYGTAEDIPALLERAVQDTDNQVWGELWSRLCHQGSVYNASFAALPALTQMAQQWPAPRRFEPLLLAAGIVACIDQPWYTPDVYSAYPTEVGQLAAVAADCLRHASLTSDSPTYVYILQALLAFEGAEVWGGHLDGINDEEYEVSCPHCEADNFVVFGRDGHFTALDSAYMKDPEARRGSLQPAQPSSVSALGQRLYATALADGHPDVAEKITYVFGRACCAECGEDFQVEEAVAARWS